MYFQTSVRTPETAPFTCKPRVLPETPDPTVNPRHPASFPHFPLICWFGVGAAFAGQTIRIVVAATDGGADNVVEAAVDDVRIRRP